MIDLSDISVQVESNDGKVGTFTIGPLPKGYGPTFANPLRRVLLSSIHGAAVTSMRIDGVDHEYSTLKGIKETIVEVQMNVKGVRFSCESNEPQVVKVSKKGEGVITAGDLELTESVSVIDPAVEIATITDPKTTFTMELVVERGVGYRTAEEELRSEVGRLPLHADFSPLERVTFSIEKTRKGEKLDLDQVNLEIMTDGSIDPQEALGKASEILSVAFGRLMGMTGVEEEPMPVETEESVEGGESEAKDWLVEDLPISKRAKTRLIEAGITKIGDITERSREELLEIKGFGEAALDEIVEVLDEYELGLKE